MPSSQVADRAEHQGSVSSCPSWLPAVQVAPHALSHQLAGSHSQSSPSPHPPLFPLFPVQEAVLHPQPPAPRPSLLVQEAGLRPQPPAAPHQLTPHRLSPSKCRRQCCARAQIWA